MPPASTIADVVLATDDGGTWRSVVTGCARKPGAAPGGSCDEVARHIGLQACLDLGTSQEVHGGAPPVRRSVSDAVVERDAVLLPPLSSA